MRILSLLSLLYLLEGPEISLPVRKMGIWQKRTRQLQLLLLLLSLETQAIAMMKESKSELLDFIFIQGKRKCLICVSILRLRVRSQRLKRCGMIWLLFYAQKTLMI